MVDTIIDPIRVEQNVNEKQIAHVKNLCLNLIEQIDELKRDSKNVAGMINDALLAEPSFVNADKLVKDSTKQKKQATEQIMKTETMRALDAQRNDIKSDLKDKQQTLSALLQDYRRISGKDIIETVKGEQLTIFTVASVSKAPKN